MDGAIEILEYLKTKNLRLAIITNGAVSGQGAKLDFIGIRHYFEEIIISDAVGLKKSKQVSLNL